MNLNRGRGKRINAERPVKRLERLLQTLARTQKEKLSTHYKPDLQIRELVPESQAYMDLLAFEQKLDATMMRKKLDIQVSSW